MSGNGPAADPAGDVYFVTGNTDRSGTSYDSHLNLAESVVKLSPGLELTDDFFTPGGPAVGEPVLDQNDYDFGAGGVLLLPPQSGAFPNLAVAAGKVGVMYLLNRDALGGYVPSGPDNDVGHVQIGPCWCGKSYFTGPDAIGRVVSSGGSNVIVWRVQTSPQTALTQESMSATVPSGQDQGFLTSVSSNGTTSGSAIIWAVARPNRFGVQNVTLLAYDASNSSTLFSGVAGSWPYLRPNANIVPVVANGRVYVASYKQLAIFGLGHAVAMNVPPAPVVPADLPLPVGEHEVFGIVRQIHGHFIAVETRGGDLLSVDTRPAVRVGGDIVVQPGEAVDLRGALGASGAFEAHVMERAKNLPELWGPDR